MLQKPKQGDSSNMMGIFFLANSSVNAVITFLLPRAAQEGLLGFARKLVHTSIFFSYLCIEFARDAARWA